jgi:hypothetical protein
MSERKVLNKYFPPGRSFRHHSSGLKEILIHLNLVTADFDPAKIPRKKVNKDAQMTVRLMAPFTMCCKTCGEFICKSRSAYGSHLNEMLINSILARTTIDKGKKFNAKKETALGEDYYGIKIFRFYIVSKVSDSC